MPRRKRETEKAKRVAVGNISDISGSLNIAAGDIHTQQTTINMSVVELQQLFDSLYATIDSRAETAPADKEDLRAELKEIQSAVTQAEQKKEKVDEGFLARRFRNIARMAPDLLDVIVATLANPLAGLGIAVHKIAAKAKEETKAP